MENVRIKIMEWIDCPECDGNGYQERETFVTQSLNNDYGFPDTETTECDNCAGTGQVEPTEEEEEE